jgi:hypothetical protein
MMISDTLSDAVNEIEEYQHRQPKVYGKWQVHIWKVTTVMDALRIWLDCPPFDGLYPRYEAARERLLAELARLDVEPLLAAVANMRVSWPTKEEAEAAKDREKRQPAKKRKKSQAGGTARNDDGSDNGVTNEVRTEDEQGKRANTGKLAGPAQEGSQR